jgi:hypothetical protein
MNGNPLASAHTPPAGLLLRSVLRVVGQLGGDVDEILRRAGILDLKACSSLHVSHAQFVAVYGECLNRLERNEARRVGRHPMGPSEFRMMCYCMISSATLGQAIERAIDFYALFDGGAGALSLRTERSTAEFCLHTAYIPGDEHMIFGVFTGLSSFARLGGWLVGKDLEPLAVKVCYGPVLDQQLVSWLLPWDIEYGAQDNTFSFPARYLALPVVRSAAELDELLRTAFPFDLGAGRSERCARFRVGAQAARHGTGAGEPAARCQLDRPPVGFEQCDAEAPTERGRHHAQATEGALPARARARPAAGSFVAAR